MKTCKSCKYFEGFTCFAEPPKVFFMNSEFEVNREVHVRPTVEVEDRACRFYEFEVKDV